MEVCDVRKFLLMMVVALIVSGCGEEKVLAPLHDGLSLRYDMLLDGKTGHMGIEFKSAGEGYNAEIEIEDADKPPIVKKVDKYGWKDSGLFGLTVPPCPVWAPPAHLAEKRDLKVHIDKNGGASTFTFFVEEEFGGRQVAVYLFEGDKGTQARMDLETGFLVKASWSTLGTAIILTLDETNVSQLKGFKAD